MFCPNCGNQLPDNVKFCGSCGTKITSAAAPAMNQDAAQQPARKEPKKKKKANLFVIGAVVLGLYLIGSGVGNSMADSYVSSQNTGNQTSQDSVSSDDHSVSSENSAAYDQVFSDRYIIPAPAIFIMLDSDAYVYVDSEGIISHLQYGYKDDIVVEYVETVYYPAELVDMQAQDEYIRSLLGNTGLDFVSLSTNIGNSYYSYTLTMRELDQLSNIQAVINAGLLTMEEENSLWSMSATEANLLAQGYIKK